MAQVLVREVEPEVIERLKERARKNGRSLEAELRLIFREAVQEKTPTSAAEELERVRALFSGRSLSDSTELLRNDRQR